MKNDILMKFYTDAITYMALKARAEKCDRSLSQHLRHLVRVDLEQACHDDRQDGSDHGGSSEGQE